MKGILMARAERAAVLAIAPAHFETVDADHVTLRFKVGPQPYRRWLHQRFTGRVTAEAWNDEIQALRVALPEPFAGLCESAHPHITLSRRAGVAPKRSNALLEDPANERALDAELEFEVVFQPF